MPWLLAFFLLVTPSPANASHEDLCLPLVSRLLNLTPDSTEHREVQEKLEAQIKSKNNKPIQVLADEIVSLGSNGSPEKAALAVRTLSHLLGSVEFSESAIAGPAEIIKATLPILEKLYPTADSPTRIAIATIFERTTLNSPAMVSHLIRDAVQTVDNPLSRAANGALQNMEIKDSDVIASSLQLIYGALISKEPEAPGKAAATLNTLLQRYQRGVGFKEERLRNAEVSNLFFQEVLKLVAASERSDHVTGYNEFDQLILQLAANADQIPQLVLPLLKGTHDRHVYKTAAAAVARNPKGASILVPDLIRLLRDPRWERMSFYHGPKGEILDALAATRDPRAIPELEKSLLKRDSECLGAGRSLLAWDAPRFLKKVAESIPVGHEIGEYDGEAYLVKEIGELGAKAAAAVPHFEKLALSQKSVSNAKRIISAIENISGKAKGKQVLAAFQAARKSNKGAAGKPPGNRFFVPITEQELTAKIDAAWKKNSNSGPGLAIHYEDLSTEIKKDLGKIETQIENSEEVSIGSGKLANGLTYRAIRGAGDAETPFYFIIYWDGKSLRAYIPKDGNTWNTDTGKAYGQDLEADLLNARERFPNQIGPDATEEAFYDLDGDDAAMLADIQQRLVPKK